MSSDYIKVEGNDSLVRDMTTHAIINTNIGEYDLYIKKRQATKEQLEKLERHEEDINTIKQDLRDIRRMLTQLLDQGK